MLKWWLDDTVFSKTAASMQGLMIKTTEVRAQISQLIDTLTKTPENIELMLEIIRKAKAIDQEVVAWQQNQGSSEDWHYRTIAWEDSVMNGDYANAEVFPGRVDIYNDVWIGSISNTAPTLRLYLHTAIVRCAAWVCSPVDYRTTPEYATASGVCRDAITDIIASVPYFLGWHLKRKDANTTPKFGNFACGDEDGVKGLAGYLVTWPLTCVISQDFTTDAQRAWALGRLRTIGRDLGVKYALAVSQLQMRVPSMLIRRDALMNTHPAGIPYGFEQIEAARLAPPRAGHALNPQQQWEAMQKKRSERGKAELIEKLTENATDDETQRAAQKWLQI
ncbi:hypothetical protein RRF57_001288 [Xylaria bambusicola]|uniref:Uncharacterized protein n=1 Tax=Xylaria bambusicola TaxID=326684 RepID=A0AAN7UDL6_9PEZI